MLGRGGPETGLKMSAQKTRSRNDVEMVSRNCLKMIQTWFGYNLEMIQNDLEFIRKLSRSSKTNNMDIMGGKITSSQT